MDAGGFLLGVAVMVSDGRSRSLYRRGPCLAMDGFAAAAMRNRDVTERSAMHRKQKPRPRSDRGCEHQMS